MSPGRVKGYTKTHSHKHRHARTLNRVGNWADYIRPFKAGGYSGSDGRHLKLLKARLQGVTTVAHLKA